MEEINLDECVGFEWDAGNQNKNWLKHGVSRFECEQVFFNEPILFFDNEKHSKVEKCIYVLGQTNNQRKLFIVFTIRNKFIRVISSRDMSKKERSIYEKAQKNSEI